MRYIPRRPREGVNVSDVHPLAEAGTLIVGLTAIFVLIALALVFLVEIALYFVPAEREARLFADWLPEDLVTIAPSDDRLFETQLLVDRLASNWADSPYTFRLEVAESGDANAMALPGGLIIVTQGLLDEVSSENELAFVLGHELGHFRNRDHIRALGRGLVLTLFFAAVTGGDVSGIGINVADVTLRSFSRKQESSADEFGLAIIYAEYGHVNEASRLFQRWAGKDRAGLIAGGYLSTHPRAGDRVAQLDELAARQGWPVEGNITPLPW
jgi:Zn-dependent protease with chaperone function